LRAAITAPAHREASHPIHGVRPEPTHRQVPQRELPQRDRNRQRGRSGNTRSTTPNSTAAFDGRFTTGHLQGRTVNVKWYLKREGVLDLTKSETLDYYLVFTGSASAAQSSRGGTRPWCIESVYLFDAKQLLNELGARGAKIGTASSVRNTEWDAAEIYPRPNNPLITVEPKQVAVLRLLALWRRNEP
jgi:hypothetical protein